MRVSDRRQPDLVLIRAKPHGDSRHVENLDQIFGRRMKNGIPSRCSVGTWRAAYFASPWVRAGPGEYAIAEMVQDEGSGPLRLGFRRG